MIGLAQPHCPISPVAPVCWRNRLLGYWVARRERTGRRWRVAPVRAVRAAKLLSFAL